MKLTTKIIALGSAALLLIGCTAEELEVDSEAAKALFTVGSNGKAASMTDQDFNQLTPEQQYQAANKLMGSLYKGVPVADFFDLTEGLDKPEPQTNDFLSSTMGKLDNKVDNQNTYWQLISERYEINDQRKPFAEPLAAMHELPLSRDQFEIWMAYTLANTILFSPAAEIDSASHIDTQKVHAGLVRAMNNNQGIRSIVLTHMKSEANWRRFRSPEDNTREMIEIYLGLFDKDDDVPLASKACQNWYLTDDDEGYQLVVNLFNENSEPQKVLDEWVTTCEDFYEMIANHNLLIPRVTTVLVDHFFPDYSSEDRAQIVQSIAEANPTHFKHLFVAILFSKEYLLNNERPKRFEETFFGVASRVSWKGDKNFFNNLTSPNESDNFPTLLKMKQPAMTLKLGRWKDQPLDSLSFANYHRAVREKLLIVPVTDELSENQYGWTASFIKDAEFLPGDDFINYIFLSVVSRKASDDEMKALLKYIDENNYSTKKKEKAIIVMDYLSRLPELYYFNVVPGQTTVTTEDSEPASKIKS